MVVSYFLTWVKSKDTKSREEAKTHQLVLCLFLFGKVDIRALKSWQWCNFDPPLATRTSCWNCQWEEIGGWLIIWRCYTTVIYLAWLTESFNGLSVALYIWTVIQESIRHNVCLFGTGSGPRISRYKKFAFIFQSSFLTLAALRCIVFNSQLIGEF